MQWPIGLIRQSVLKQNWLKSQLIVIDLTLPFGMRYNHIFFGVLLLRNAMAHRSYKAGPPKGVQANPLFPLNTFKKVGWAVAKSGQI